MNRFLLKILIFSFFPLVTLYGVFLLENGTADPFYQRFTSPKQSALILGNSKAAQGIVPSVLDSKLFPEFGAKIYNYSFTVYNSPFGPVYLESLAKKLDEKSKRGYFVITVDPWSIASDIKDPDNLEKFEENNGFLASINDVNSTPNIFYLLGWFENPFYEIILMKLKNDFSKLHPDGWFEVRGGRKIERVVLKRREFMVDFYSDYLNKYSYSEKRFENLQKTIAYLKEKGPVFLVRMPLHQDILSIDDKLDPEFNRKMENLSKAYGIPYFDFNDFQNDWQFKDGLHMTVESAKDFSLELSDKILQSTN
jgi:hypothetical protein